MAGPLVHLAAAKKVWAELGKHGIRFQEPIKSDIVAMIESLEPDLRRQHASYNPVTGQGNLFPEVNRLYRLLIDKTTPEQIYIRTIFYLTHYLLDCHWIGHLDYGIEKWYEPCAELILKKDNGRCAMNEDIRSMEELIELTKRGIEYIYNTYFNFAKKSPWKFIVFHNREFKASVQLAVQLAAEAAVVFILFAERNKR